MHIIDLVCFGVKLSSCTHKKRTWSQLCHSLHVLRLRKLPSLSKRATPKPHADEYTEPFGTKANKDCYINIPRGVLVALLLTENLKFSGFQHVKVKAFRKRLLCMYIPPFPASQRGAFLRGTVQR